MATKKGTKMRAAKEYLSKHGIEVRLAEVMSAVLRERPDNPANFIAELLKEGADCDAKPPPVAPRPAAKAEPDVPKAVAVKPTTRPEAEPDVPKAVAVKPTTRPEGWNGGAYYQKNMLPSVSTAQWGALHARFPKV